jgi:predicted N-acetyltransferase YhbS
MPDPVLRRATRQDTPGICALLRRAFPDNAKARPEILDWQYWDNPFGQPTVLVWDDAGRIAGHYAVVTYPAVLDGRPGRLGIGIDAAVDPDYQGRQLFGPLARELYQQATAGGHDAVVCYPNDNSVRGIARQGWQELGLLRTRILPLRPGWYASRTGIPAPLLAPPVAALRLRARRGTAGHQAREIDRPPTDADALWTLAGSGTVNGVIRDGAWLQWRYADRPGPSPYRWFEARREGAPRALAVTTEQQQRGGTFTYLLELIAAEPAAARAVVAEVAQASPESAGVLLATLPGTTPARLAAAAGLLPVPARLEEKQLHFGLVDPVPELRTGWSLGWGDLDHL